MPSKVCQTELHPQSAGEEPSHAQMSGSIIAIGSTLAGRMLCNRDLANEFGVTSDWIDQRCGIRQRYVADHETATSLGVDAACKAIEQSSERPDLLLCATYSPDRLLAPIAPRIAHLAGLGQIGAFDINAACCGGVSAFLTALAYINVRLFRNVLIVATDTTTKHLDGADLKTRMLFSDGAIAILLGPRDNQRPHVLVRSHRFGSDGERSDLFGAKWGDQKGSRPHVTMDGSAMFRFAVEAGSSLLNVLCADSGITPEEVDRVLIHQANARITRAIQREFNGRCDSWPCSLHLGNLAGASVLFLLAQEIMNPANPFTGLLALVAFGAGLTWAGAILEVSS